MATRISGGVDLLVDLLDLARGQIALQAPVVRAPDELPNLEARLACEVELRGIARQDGPPMPKARLRHWNRRTLLPFRRLDVEIRNDAGDARGDLGAGHHRPDRCNALTLTTRQLVRDHLDCRPSHACPHVLRRRLLGQASAPSAGTCGLCDAEQPLVVNRTSLLDHVARLRSAAIRL